MADPLAAGVTEGGPETTIAEDTSTDAGTTVSESTVDDGQAQASAETAIDSFFDPSTLSPELQPAYKQMQAAYTKKTQAIAEQRGKVESYDRFLNDPAFRAQLAAQYGFGAAQPEQQQEDWAPETWEDVMTKAEDRALARFRQEAQPLLKEVQNVKKTQIEKDLDEHVPEWRTYEDEMSQALQEHPTLASNPVMLARLALPQQLLDSKAMQQALKKLESKSKGASVSKGSSTGAPAGAEIPRQRRTFQEAYQAAKQNVADALK